MTTKWGGLWPPHLRFRPGEICSDQGPWWFACASRQTIAVPTDTTAPFNALISWKLRCSGRPRAQASTPSHPSNSNELTLPCRPAPENCKLDRNFFKFGFGRHTCRTISLGTESNLGHYASGAINEKIGHFRPIDFLCLQNGRSNPADGHKLVVRTVTNRCPCHPEHLE